MTLRVAHSYFNGQGPSLLRLVKGAPMIYHQCARTSFADGASTGADTPRHDLGPVQRTRFIASISRRSLPDPRALLAASIGSHVGDYEFAIEDRPRHVALFHSSKLLISNPLFIKALLDPFQTNPEVRHTSSAVS